ESKAPDIGEAGPGEPKLPRETVQHIVNNNIYGNVSNFASGSNVTLNSVTNIEAGNVNSLVDYLKENGIESEDLAKLQQAIREDGSTVPKGEFGERVNAWLGRMVGKAFSATEQIALGVTSNFLYESIKKYYGF